MKITERMVSMEMSRGRPVEGVSNADEDATVDWWEAMAWSAECSWAE